jgi:hypothetical protein
MRSPSAASTTVAARSISPRAAPSSAAENTRPAHRLRRFDGRRRRPDSRKSRLLLDAAPQLVAYAPIDIS